MAADFPKECLGKKESSLRKQKRLIRKAKKD